MVVPTLLRVLMIGNSFSVCVGNYMPPIVQSVPGYELHLTSAYIGGCSLERHHLNIVQSQTNPEAQQYAITTWKTQGEAPIEKIMYRASINGLLESNEWDVITLQQASHLSWNYNTYQPYADHLVAFIREKAPNAKIYIQQTWAYRADESRLQPGRAWGFDQAGMHARVTDAYEKLSQHIQAPLIPTGNAIARYRARVYPTPPPTETNTVASVATATPIDYSIDPVSDDKYHLNSLGHYLQACTWFLRLYGLEKLPDSVYSPSQIEPERAALLRAAAEDAVRACLQAEAKP